jgi:hypothetical protein
METMKLDRMMKLIGAAALVAATAFGQPRSEVGARQANQQRRIAQGVKSGSLTAGETARLEGKEARLNREIRRDRAQNGGALTPRQRRQVNRQQNRLSRQIYRAKHNAVRRP